jgi:hypothetical protein
MQSLSIGGPYGLRFAKTGALMVQPDGKLVAAGSGNGDFVAVRYRGDYVGCPSLPLTCHTAARAIALVKNDATDARDRLMWKWFRGAPTSIDEFGDPGAGSPYALCVYEGDPPVLLGQAVVPSDSPHWRVLNDGYGYRDPDAAVDGIGRILLESSSKARSRVIVNGGGAALADLPLPLEAPVRFQLVNLGTGACWGSTLEASSIRRNDGRLFHARH